jgi:hypothetical protein
MKSYKYLSLLLFLFLFSSLSAQVTVQGVDESLVNVVEAKDFDFAGSWTAYIYAVEYHRETESVTGFDLTDSVHSVFYQRLVGFPTKAYRLLSMNNQSFWDDAVINLADDSDKYQVYWLGLDSLEAFSTITTYGEIAIQFNIDVEDMSDTIDDNLFIELVRNESSKKY